MTFPPKVSTEIFIPGIGRVALTSSRKICAKSRRGIVLSPMTSPPKVSAEVSICDVARPLAGLRRMADQGQIDEELYLELARSLVARPLANAATAHIDRCIARLRRRCLLTVSSR